MGGSAAEAPTMPDAQPVRGLRASDAERDEVVARLTEEFAAGRLSHDTFLFRMHAVLETRHQSDLPRVLADLPGGNPLPPARRAGARGLAGRLKTALPRLTGSGLTLFRGPVFRGPVFRGPVFRGPAAQARWPHIGPGRGLADARASAEADRGQATALEFPRGAGTEFSIGRETGCDLAIADMTVSRVHARLERTPDGWLLSDLSSTNGTRVNGWLVRGQVPVRAGDLVSFGNAEYWLSAAEEI